MPFLWRLYLCGKSDLCINLSCVWNVGLDCNSPPVQSVEIHTRKLSHIHVRTFQLCVFVELITRNQPPILAALSTKDQRTGSPEWHVSVFAVCTGQSPAVCVSQSQPAYFLPCACTTCSPNSATFRFFQRRK
jgi:hypothetical protein